MKKIILILSIVFILSACVPPPETTTVYYPTRETHYYPNSYNYAYYTWSDSDNNSEYNSYEERPLQPSVEVPQSYHVGPYKSPVSHQEVDRTWAESQNPNAYTIQIADGEKPAPVAMKLHQAPKTNRAAEVSYLKDGKAVYKGVYGSYSSYEEAQKAMQNLPTELRNNAQIINWKNVQD